MTWQELQEHFKGKLILIGLNFINQNDDLLEQYQTHGTVSELTNEGLLRIKQKDDSIFQIPYDKDSIELADKGEYRLRASGELVKDPDFIMEWNVIINAGDNLERIKSHGYIPAD